MKPLNFGKKRALLVNSKTTRYTDIINKLKEFTSVNLWENNTNNEWNYKSYSKIKEVPYLIRPIIEKRNKNGSLVKCEQYFFFLTTIKGKNICCFIEKKNPLNKSNIYQVRYRFKKHLFNNTLFTGTLTKSDDLRLVEREKVCNLFSETFLSIGREVSSPGKYDNWVFLIDDIWIYSSREITSILSQRMTLIQDIIGKEWYPDPKLDNCDFEVINYYNYNKIENFLRNERKYYPYLISDSNVVFTSTQGMPGLDEYTICLKNEIPIPDISETISYKKGQWDIKNIKQEEINIKNNEIKELFLKESDFPDVYWVYDKQWNKLGVARVRTMDESNFLKKKIKNNNHILLKCKWVEEFSKWQPLIKIN